MTNTTEALTTIPCDTCGAGPAESCFDSATGLSTPTHAARKPRRLSVQEALTVLTTDGEVWSAYDEHANFLGRFDATTDAKKNRVEAYIDSRGGYLLDWVTGERL